MRNEREELVVLAASDHSGHQLGLSILDKRTCNFGGLFSICNYVWLCQLCILTRELDILTWSSTFFFPIPFGILCSLYPSSHRYFSSFSPLASQFCRPPTPCPFSAPSAECVPFQLQLILFQFQSLMQIHSVILDEEACYQWWDIWSIFFGGQCAGKDFLWSASPSVLYELLSLRSASSS